MRKSNWKEVEKRRLEKQGIIKTATKWAPAPIGV